MYPITEICVNHYWDDCQTSEVRESSVIATKCFLSMHVHQVIHKESLSKITHIIESTGKCAGR